LNSVVALPLIGCNGDPFGVINIYAVSRNAFIKDEVKLMAELAGDMSYGIEGLRSRKERLIAEQNLEKALKEKEALIQELYHRTKNNMQIISAFLGMQAHLARDEILARPFREMESRIRAMALVHDKLYKSKNLSQINLKEYIPELVNLLLNGYPNLSGKLEFDIDIDEIFVTIDIASPCGLVITELLTNSFKYAFPGDRAGLITIRLRKENESFINLNISDNGVGSNEIVDITKIDSLGIPMIATIIENQLHGTVAHDTLNGFNWNIRFRYDLYKERV
jgi:two-component sensor histidine kinase